MGRGQASGQGGVGDGEGVGGPPVVSVVGGWAEARDPSLLPCQLTASREGTEGNCPYSIVNKGSGWGGGGRNGRLKFLMFLLNVAPARTGQGHGGE